VVMSLIASATGSAIYMKYFNHPLSYDSYATQLLIPKQHKYF